MHGSDLGSALLLSAKVDSMGGVIDSGVGIDLKTYPCGAAIVNAQAELRQEYDAREERRKELEFLEKGGNPLDFKFGSATSASAQSTSLTDQHCEQFMTSEAKCSFALTASPHEDSVESSGRPGAHSVCESNIADNLLLFDGETVSPEGEKRMSRKNAVTPREKSSQTNDSQNAKESEDSAIFRPYARRNRTRSNRDESRGGLRDGKGLLRERNHLKDQKVPPTSVPNHVSTNNNIFCNDQASTKSIDLELDGGRPIDNSARGIPDDKSHQTGLKSSTKEEIRLPLQDGILPEDTALASNAYAVEKLKQVPSANLDDPPSSTAMSETQSDPCQRNDASHLKDYSKGKLDQDKIKSDIIVSKGLDSCIQTSVGSDLNNDSNICVDENNDVSVGYTVGQKSEFGNGPNLVSGEVFKDDSKNNTVDGCADVNIDQSSLGQNDSPTVGLVKVEEGMPLSCSVMQNELKDPLDVTGTQQNEHTIPKSDKIEDGVLSELPKSYMEEFFGRRKVLFESSNFEVPAAGIDATAALDSQTCNTKGLTLVDKAHEDSILEEARTIQAKWKRIAELSTHSLPFQTGQKSHWDFVLEEMSWLAYDFAQERLWKLTAAAQVCYQSVVASQLRSEKKAKYWKMKSLAHNIAKTVMQFWHKVELLIDSDNRGFESMKLDHDRVSVDKRNSNVLISKILDGQYSETSVRGYAVRFVKYNRSLISSFQAEAPATPDIISDSRTVDMSWKEQLSEEALFYTIPATAVEMYREFIESHLTHEKIGLIIHEEVETSTQYTLAGCGSEEVYAEDEGEPITCHVPDSFENIMTSKSVQRKYKAASKSSNRWISEAGIDLPYGHCMTAPPHSIPSGKGSASLNVGTIPTKRMRTATRQRISCPFGPGVTVNVHTPNKADASSGDTNSFQDDHSVLYGGPQMQKSVEVESVCDFEKQLCYDYAETSVKSKKMKKTKHGFAYDRGWQVDCEVLNEQKDHSKKSSDNHHLESNGTSGFFLNHVAKKPKMMNQSIDSIYDNVSPVTGSIPSPAASQMSTMSNQNRLIKLVTGSGRERGRKPKPFKMSDVQSGAGTPWSLFEDQALIVLVHDMGPNWELISDAINGTLHFKCVFRKPKECKERHKTLMKRSHGDGADNADDSGFCQSYPSTLPGIPKGSARQLFQRLKGPMEEDILKSHFDKIIKLGQKQHFRGNQNHSQHPKQIIPVHNSHMDALSKACPNHMNEVVLTPLDLCDATASSPDVLPHGYQDTLPDGSALSNQGSVGSLLPTSGVNSTLQGSSGMIMGSNLPSPSSSLPTSMRCGVPRASLPTDEQQRMQQCTQMLSGRNAQQSITGSLSGSDRGVHMLRGGNGTGVMCGVNRSMPMSRLGSQGMASSSMGNPVSVLSSGVVGVGLVNMHSGAGPVPLSSVLRPRDALQVIQSGHNPDHHRQMVVPDLQIQVTQGATQSMPAFSGLSSPFKNQTTVQPFPGHGLQQHQISHQQAHLSSPHHPHLLGSSQATNSPQQAYAMRLAKERQKQHQHQCAASSALMPHVHSQSQLPVSSVQNSPPIQSQSSPLPASLPSVTPSTPVTSVNSQYQEKCILPQHGESRSTSSGLSNQAVKQCQRQLQQPQIQQPSRHHPTQRQHVQSQPQAKVLKGVGRGNVVGGQNISVDSSHPNGQSMPPGNQIGEKGDQIVHMMEGLDTYSGLNQPSKFLSLSQSSNHTQLQHKIHSSPAAVSSKQIQQLVPAHNSTLGQVPKVPPVHISSTSLSVMSSTVASSHQSRLQPKSPSLPKQVNQTQPSQVSQKTLLNSRLVQSESPNKSQACTSQVEQQQTKNAISEGSAAPQAGVDTGLQNLAGQEMSPPTKQGLDPSQLSGSLHSHGCNSSAQWQEQLLVRPPPSQPSSHQSLQPRE